MNFKPKTYKSFEEATKVSIPGYSDTKIDNRDVFGYLESGQVILARQEYDDETEQTYSVAHRILNADTLMNELRHEIEEGLSWVELCESYAEEETIKQYLPEIARSMQAVLKEVNSLAAIIFKE